MLDSETKSRINTARDILVGKVPDPKSQVEQITIALIYKFMDDMDVESEELGGKRTFFVGDYAKYAWRKIFDPRQSGFELLNLYSEAIDKMDTNPGVPKLFRDIFKNAYLPYRDPETLKSFLKIINEFDYSHSEKLGDAFEYLLSVLGSQGDAGQFRTPRHIIDFMVEIVDPRKDETILDPACGTAGFLISSYKHIIRQNSSNYSPDEHNGISSNGDLSVAERIISTNGYAGDKLTADDRKLLAMNIHGYDISPDMVRLSLVNMYLHGIKDPKIFEYDTLTSEDNWHHYSDVILANPPFMSPKGGIRPHKRFSVQSNRSEVLFVDYIAEHLTTDGRAAVIVPEGIIFQSGKAYKQLRKMLVEDYLVGVISLPAGVFNPYSGVKTSILWLDKVLAKKIDKILFVKIENDGFDLGAQRRAVKGSDLPVMIQKVSGYKSQIVTGMLPNLEMGNNIVLVPKTHVSNTGDYNLSGERYTVKEKSNGVYPVIKLKGLYEFVRGVTYTKSDEVENDGTVILRANNINLDTGHLDFTDLKQIKPEVKVKNEQKLLKNDILICTASGSAEHIGKVAFSAENTCYYFGGFMGVLRTDYTKLRPKYLHTILKSQNFRDYINRTTVGANIRNLKGSILDNFELSLPSVKTQDEILSEIESYQKIIDGARQVVENYKPRIEINPNWEIVKLGDLVYQFQYGSSKKSLQEGDVPCLRMGNIQGGEIIWDDLKYAPPDEELEKYTLEPSDVLFNRTNSAVHVGKTGIYRGSRKAVFAGYLIRIKYKKERIIGEYLNYCLNTASAKEFYMKIKTDGINQSNINPNLLATYKIPLPTIEVQRQIATELQNEKYLIDGNKQIIQSFEQKIKDRIAKVWGE